MKILVTGVPGQLAHCIYDETQSHFIRDEFLFTDKKTLDITDFNCVDNFFAEHNDIDVVINCAAYTNVEKAEKDIVGAFQVNSRGVKNIVDACEKYDMTLFHISTDYVYEGGICMEDSPLKPLNIYAQSKRDGELHIEKSNIKKWFIFRTSWLFSEYDGNYVTNILKKAQDITQIMYGVTDEIGCPTYARKLAAILINLIDTGKYITMDNGIYNVCGGGYTSRYEFTKTILGGYVNLPMFTEKYTNDLDYNYYAKLLHVNPITKVEAYKMFNLKAPRPDTVILNNKKIHSVIDYDEYHNFIVNDFMRDSWENDLADCLTRYNELHQD